MYTLLTYYYCIPFVYFYTPTPPYISETLVIDEPNSLSITFCSEICQKYFTSALNLAIWRETSCIECQRDREKQTLFNILLYTVTINNSGRIIENNSLYSFLIRIIKDKIQMLHCVLIKLKKKIQIYFVMLLEIGSTHL